jgi:flagellar biosynthetic protein FlhB
MSDTFTGAPRDPGAVAPPALPSFDLQRFAVEERNLPASRRRRERARGEGRTARSPDLGASLALFAAGVALVIAAPAAVRGFLSWSAALLGSGPPAQLGVAAIFSLARAAGGIAAALLLPVLGAAAVLGALADVAQSGLALSLRAITPNLGRLNPVQGLARLFSLRALVDLGRALVKGGAVLLLAYGPLRQMTLALAAGRLALGAELLLVGQTALGIVFRAAAVQLVAGGADYAFARWDLERSLRMSPREFRDELRETEGDPGLRARRRRRQRELARRRMLADVRRADVVVANPVHVAVALRYEAARMAAPRVVARGAEHMAERIKAVARAAGVLVVENPPLARALYGTTRVGQPVPAALYQAVAEVLAYVWRVERRVLPPATAQPGRRDADGGVPW